MPLLFKNIRAGKRRALVTDLANIARRELEKALDAHIKPLLITSHDRVVADWENKPKFQTQKRIRPDRIVMTVFPTGDAAEIYGHVDQGTKPHLIKPVRAKVLRFKIGYIAKTLPHPARTVIGGGRTTGPEVRAKLVHHPGSEGQKFSKTIAKDIEPDFQRVIENTFRRVSKQVEE